MNNYKYYNAHPEGKNVKDCVKRAITLVSQMDYHTVQLELNRYKKITGAKVYNERKNCDAYCENVLLMKKLSFPAVKGQERMSGDKFTKTYPKGRYILNMAGHWTSCIDGVIFDTWDCRDKCVYTAYRMLNQDEWEHLQHLKQQQIEVKKQEQLKKEQKKSAIKKIKDKYNKKIKPLQKKIKELEKLMKLEIENIK